MRVMRRLLILGVLLPLVSRVARAGEAVPAPAAPVAPTTRQAVPDWPAPTREMRPGTYWWWPGSAVDRDSLTHELERFQAAGLGTVHIIPIYGVKTFEDRYIDYLSPRWMEMLGVLGSEASRLQMGYDMTLGTGWCFGGPGVTPDEGCQRMVYQAIDAVPRKAIPGGIDRTRLETIAAFGPEQQYRNLTSLLTPEGTLNWTAPSEGWRVIILSRRPTGLKVKRAAPGGAGLMINPFDANAMARYLQRFSTAFAAYKGILPGAVYHDSYEYNSDWSANLLDEFARRRGYRLEEHLDDLTTLDPTDDAARVKCDYRHTISDMMIEQSMPLWIQWAHQRGIQARYQAHGSPANLLDLYALADIPETEMFSRDRSILVSKMASSAAHVAGRPLVSSETGTWVKEHFNVTLADLKLLVDDLFLSGVNHVYYHGTCFSPDGVPWPGWLFYASTEMNPRNAIWHDVPALNAYITRAQSILQAGQSDNDVLVYWPVEQTWQNPLGMVMPFTVHDRKWMEDAPIGKLGHQLQSLGYVFDFVSDRQLAGAKVEGGRIALPGGSYAVVVVPACSIMNLATYRQLVTLVQGGGKVIFEGKPPVDVPGLADLQKRQAEAAALAQSVTKAAAAPAGAGRFFIGDLEKALAEAGAVSDPFSDALQFQHIRRRVADGRYYFISNRSDAYDGWIALGHPAASATLMDPMTGDIGLARTRQRDGHIEVYVQVARGGSLIVRTSDAGVPPVEAWQYIGIKGQGIELIGEWTVKFIDGGPAIPKAFTTSPLESWAGNGDPDAECFAGTATYSLNFDLPSADPRKRYVLDLGKVCQSARVRVNGRNLGTLIGPTYRIAVSGLKPSGNLIEVDVTNLSANRIRDLDRRNIQWRIFNDINFVNMNYKPFDASKWPVADSGLLGPVKLYETGPVLNMNLQ